MNDLPRNTKTFQARSFTSIYDILSPMPFKNDHRLGPQNNRNTISIFQASCNPKYKTAYGQEESILFNQTSYVTSENYHFLHKNTSDKSVKRSTSTLFYDLDHLAKRHSYHCVSESLELPNKKEPKTKGDKSYKSGFGAKSEAIVQECETKILPKLKIRDSKQTNAKKVKRTCVNEPMLSSDILLNDDYINRRSNSCAQDAQEDHRPQKFWSYAKYRTEYTNPLSEKKKSSKKDRGKRTEDPCPCQLFSYACPCTDKKSLTELAKSSKTLTVAEQMTGTSNLFLAIDQVHKPSKVKQSRGSDYYDDKPTNTDIGYTNKYEVVIASEGPITEVTETNKCSKVIDNNSYVKNNTKSTSKPRKKSKQIMCPRCNEKLDILSTTEDEGSLKSRNSPACRNQSFSSPTENNFNSNVPNDFETCNHNPPCELVPVCQILPIDNVYFNTKFTNKFSTAKHNQKSIKITKACRHHPPCTVVPSCQRVNVLNNNCEFIPPCLHRPRCVNLPLCVPFTKSLNYEELLPKNTEENDNSEYSNPPRCKYLPGYQHDSLNNSIDQQFHTTQNTCEYVSEYTPRFILNPKLANVIPATFSPCKLPSPILCHCCRSNKSCQYDCIDCKCTSSFKQKAKRSASSDAVIYIRDVGCQFRYKNVFPKDSLLRSKDSSPSFDLNGTKASYYTNYHTLRYEDKCTNPESGEDLSMSTFTTSSLEIDVHCPSHGKQAKGKMDSGFSPILTTSPFVNAFTTHSDPYYDENEHISKTNTRTRLNAYPTKSRRSFLQNKYKKAFFVRRRRKSRANHISYSSSRRIPLNLKTL